MRTTRSSFRHRRSLVTPWTVAIGTAAVAAVFGFTFLADPAASPDRGGAARTEPIDTGEVNAMGMPVIATPGSAGETAVAGPVEVVGASWTLGRVPLDAAVRPSWLLRNTGTAPVTIGEPHAEVRQGCCPGPFTLDGSTIPPGGEAMLDFELSMHPGMDGWHDIAVHVPVAHAGGQDVLTLEVTGDFRDA